MLTALEVVKKKSLSQKQDKPFTGMNIAGADALIGPPFCRMGRFSTGRSGDRRVRFQLLNDKLCEIQVFQPFGVDRGIGGVIIVQILGDLESPSDCKEIKPVNPKGNQP